MTPEERKEFDELKMLVKSIHAATDPSFVEAIKRFAVGDSLKVVNANLSAASLNTTADGVDVAKDYDFSILLEDASGNQYTLGRYT